MNSKELKKAEYLASWWSFYPDWALDLVSQPEG